MRRESINFLERETEKVTPRRRGLIFFIVIAVLLVLGGCVRYAMTTAIPQDPTSYDPITLEPKKPEGFLERIKHFVFSKEVKLEGERRDRINLLLLGQGGLGHDGPFLTDTIIIASIRPSTGEVAFTSIPRDLYVNIPGRGKRKINHANAFGEADNPGKGAELATRVIEETFSLDIDYYLRVDFKAFEELIDEVNGVRVNVEKKFIDIEYPAANDAYTSVSFQKGPQTMDGQTALEFVRSRHGNNGEGSDFARSKRQQKVLLALKEKILSFQTLANPIRIKNIIDTLGDHVTTDMQFSDMVAMMKLAKELDTSNIITLSLDNSSDGYLKNGITSDGAYILEPVAGNFEGINNAIEHIFDTPPEISITAAPQIPDITKQKEKTLTIEIQNGTWRAGLGSRTRKRLEDVGLTVNTVGNTNERPYLTGGMYLLTDGLDNDKVTAIQEELHISQRNTPPSGESASTSTDILIILGEDFIEPN